MIPYIAPPLVSSYLHRVGAGRMQLLALFVLSFTVGGESVEGEDDEGDEVQEVGGINFESTEGLHGQLQRASTRYTVFGEEPLVARLPPIEERQTPEQAMKLFTSWKGKDAALDRGNIALAQSSEAPKYLIFDTDEGGLNNMRMLFEYVVQLAATTGRVLVLPPKEGWYLIDWGPLNARNKTDQKWIDMSTLSSYQEFWDIDDLKNYINVAPASSFFHREQERFQIPDDVNPEKVPPTNSSDPNFWKKWLFKNASRSVGCNASSSLAHSDTKLVYMPMKSKASDSAQYRYFDCKPKDLGETLVHFNPRYFNMVSKLLGGEGKVKDLKFGNYAAVHLRRNDFQYTQAPSAEGSNTIISEVSKYLSPGDAVYIASDEIDDSWWDGFRSALDKSHYRLISLKDFKTDLESMGATRRHLAVLEMTICAGAKIFFGTPLSTYTVGIQEMREKIYKYQKRHNSGVEEEKEATSTSPVYHGEKLFVQL